MSAAAVETAWLSQAREGTPAERDAACREIYEALRGRVFQVCLQLCGERSLAEDAMQNAFFAAFRGLGGFRGEALLSTWIYRVAIREALALRAARVSAGPLDESMPSNEAPIDAQVEARERARATQTAFRLLSAEHQAVLTLFAVEGLKHRQVAEVLGVAEGTVWSRLHEARRELRARLPGC